MSNRILHLRLISLCPLEEAIAQTTRLWHTVLAILSYARGSCQPHHLLRHCNLESRLYSIKPRCIFVNATLEARLINWVHLWSSPLLPRPDDWEGGYDIDTTLLE
jgi:hypothetical protein